MVCKRSTKGKDSRKTSATECSEAWNGIKTGFDSCRIKRLLWGARARQRVKRCDPTVSWMYAKVCVSETVGETERFMQYDHHFRWYRR